MAWIARGDAVIDRALQVIANSVTLEQLSQAQAVVLPIRFRMSLKQTAQVAGLSLGWVSKLRNRFIQGKPVGDASVPASATVTAGPVAAASAPAAKDMLAAFVKADANKDGKLKREEAANVPGLAVKFEVLDIDKDGMLSKAEFEKAVQ